MENALYIMLSSTGTGMGKLIRLFTRYPYNHVSVSTDPALRTWHSFARINRHAPLVGGLVEESPERFALDCQQMPVLLYRIPLSGDAARRIHGLLKTAAENANALTYNSFSAVASLLHKALPISGAYTCLDFANLLLGTKCSSISDLQGVLHPFLHYEGDFFLLVPPSGSCAPAYLAPMNYFTIFRKTLMHFLNLFRRLLSPKSQTDPLKCKCTEKNSLL